MALSTARPSSHYSEQETRMMNGSSLLGCIIITAAAPVLVNQLGDSHQFYLSSSDPHCWSKIAPLWGSHGKRQHGACLGVLQWKLVDLYVPLNG